MCPRRTERGQRAPSQAQASGSQRPRDPGILCLLAPSRNRAPRARCKGEPAFAAGDRWRRTKERGDTRKWGPKTPGARGASGAGARRCLGPRAGSGGRWRSGERQRGEGGPRCGPPTRQRLQAPGRFRRSACAKPPGPLGDSVCLLRAFTSGECPSSRGRPGLPRTGFGWSQLRAQAPDLRLSMQIAGLLPWVTGGPTVAAGGGATGVP